MPIIKSDNKIQLSAEAEEIFDKVIWELQNAEEMGGVEDDQDYLNLMEKIKTECEARIATCLANKGDSKNG